MMHDGRVKKRPVFFTRSQCYVKKTGLFFTYLFKMNQTADCGEKANYYVNQPLFELLSRLG